MTNWLKKSVRKKRFWFVSVLLVSLLSCYIFRRPILRSFYSYLNVGEMVNGAYDYAIILGGEPLDRPSSAAELYKLGKVKTLICTGSQIPRPLKAIGILQTEAEATKNRLVGLGVPDDAIILLPEATSTREEADALDKLFVNKKRGKLLIITTETHTRRALGTFKEYCDPWDEMDAYGVRPTHYDPNWWWKTEFGFLAIFEEYLKLVYYWVAY